MMREIVPFSYLKIILTILPENKQAMAGRG